MIEKYHAIREIVLDVVGERYIEYKDYHNSKTIINTFIEILTVMVAQPKYSILTPRWIEESLIGKSEERMEIVLSMCESIRYRLLIDSIAIPAGIYNNEELIAGLGDNTKDQLSSTGIKEYFGGIPVEKTWMQFVYIVSINLTYSDIVEIQNTKTEEK